MASSALVNSDDEGEEPAERGSALTVILLLDTGFLSGPPSLRARGQVQISDCAHSQCDTDGSHASCVFVVLIVGAYPISAVASKQACCTLHPPPGGVDISSSSSIHRTLFLFRDRCCCFPRRCLRKIFLPVLLCFCFGS